MKKETREEEDGKLGILIYFSYLLIIIKLMGSVLGMGLGG